MRGLWRILSARMYGAAAIASLLLVTCCSCLDSEHPLSSINTAKIDESLIGCWVGVAGPVARRGRNADSAATGRHLSGDRQERQGYVPTALLKLAVFCFRTDGVLETNTRNFFVTKLGDHSYLNLECTMTARSLRTIPATAS